MNSIEFKGVSSTTIDGLLICELPPISKPPMRTKQTYVDGRHGSKIEELGYSPYDKAVAIGLHGNFDINKVIKYFSGEGDIVFSNEPDKVYHGCIINQIDYNRLLRFRKATVTFRVQPFKHKHREAYVEAKTATASGTSLVFNDSTNARFKSFRIFGKSTQNGTPTPTAPIDIVSLGADGIVAVTVNEASTSIAILNGLKGIPVTDKSLATYTDASGQMWCADEIDISRGAYVQRVSENIILNFGLAENAGENVYLYSAFIPNARNVLNTKALSTHFEWVKSGALAQMIEGQMIVRDRPDYPVIYCASSITKESEFNDWISKNNVRFLTILSTPIETPLTEAEILACKSLVSNEPTTTITNDENAPMTVEYFKPYEVFNEGLEESKPMVVIKGSGTIEMKVNGSAVFTYTFPDGEGEVVLDSEAEDAYLGAALKNRNMLGEFPVLAPKTNKIEWTGDVTSLQILPRSRWL